MVRGAYDIQQLRIEAGNRLCANFRSKLGLDPNEKPSEVPKVLKELKLRYEKITDGVVEISRRRKFDFDGVISNRTELNLVRHYLELVSNEKTLFQNLEHALRSFPIWTEYLHGVRGVGPAMASVIISEVDISRARYPSSLWKYAGLDVAEDGAGRSRRKEHLIDVEYKDKNGKMATRKSITFNAFLKTKLTGVLAGSFLRVGENKYAEIYAGYRHRLDSRPDLSEHSKGHKHNMALRYMIKMFLMDLHVVWRTLEGLEATIPYHEAKLDIKHQA